MGDKSTVKKRLINFEQEDERALALIQRETGLSPMGAVRWALRLAELVYEEKEKNKILLTRLMSKTGVSNNYHAEYGYKTKSRTNKNLRWTIRAVEIVEQINGVMQTRRRPDPKRERQIAEPTQPPIDLSILEIPIPTAPSTDTTELAAPNKKEPPKPVRNPSWTIYYGDQSDRQVELLTIESATEQLAILEAVKKLEENRLVPEGKNELRIYGDNYYAVKIVTILWR